MNNKIKDVSEWVEEKHKKSRDSTIYWTEGYKLKITEAILKYMEDSNISEEEIRDNVSFDWDEFLKFYQFSLRNLAEVSMVLGIDWEFNITEVSEGGD